MTDPRLDRDGDDAGLTLVEVIIYITLSTIVATIVTFMLINTFKGQDNVTTVTHATTRGQVIAEGIERAVRNSLAYTISPDGTELKVLTSLAEPCQAWRVNGTTLEISTGVGFHTWAPFAENVTLPTLPDGRTAFFVQKSTKVTYAFAFETDGSPVRFIGEALPRTSGGSVTISCS